MKAAAAFIFAVVIAVAALGAETAAPRSDLVLWYDKPAVRWEQEALPIGNAYMGAMLFGGVGCEHIQFNEESLWIGDEEDTGAYQAFGEVLVQLGDTSDGKAREIKSPRGQGAVMGTATAYRRELDIACAVHTVTYEDGGVHYRREAFASYPAQVILFRFTADKPRRSAARWR